MTKPTFKEQFDKLTEAYIKGEVNPFDVCSCFVGNLLNRTNNWAYARINMLGSVVDYGLIGSNPDNIQYAAKCISENSNGLYTPEEIIYLENVFMRVFTGDKGIKSSKDTKDVTEDELFEAFELTLDELKKIHIAKGEIIDESPVFRKRELLTV